jgi:hypothetical protein
MIKLDERISITKKTAIEAVSISVTNAKESIKQSKPQKAEKYSDAAPGPLRSTRISSLRYQRSRVKPLKTSIKFNPVSPFLVKTARLQTGRRKFKPIKKFFGICRDELDPLQGVPKRNIRTTKSQLVCSRAASSPRS